jgi:L-iditol 2-dehydrogenase
MEKNDKFELLLTAPKSIGKRSLSVDRPFGTTVLVRVNTVGICATDLALYAGTYGAPHAMPICFGHEWSGVVEEVGDSVQRLRPGDKITGECSLWCGQCDRCRRNPNLCRRIQKFGITTAGAARTHVVIDERHLHSPADDVDLSTLALAEPLAVAAKGIAAAGAAHNEELVDQRILVLGGGMIGMACVAVLRLLYQCSDVALCDPVLERRIRAASFGAKPLEVTTNVALRDRAGYDELYGLEGYDVIFETTGAGTAFEQALLHLNAGGTLALLGFLGETAFSPKSLTLKAARMVGSIGGSGAFETVIPWLTERAEELRSLITHQFDAEDFERAFTTAVDHRSALKTQLIFSSN